MKKLLFIVIVFSAAPFLVYGQNYIIKDIPNVGDDGLQEKVVDKLIPDDSNKKMRDILIADLTEVVSENKESVENISLAGAAVGVVSVTATTSVPFFSTMPLAIKDIFLLPLLGLLTRRKNKKNWGVVFEKTTKQPIPGVRLNLVNERGKGLDVIYSDKNGRFGFLATDGTYSIQVKKEKYEEDYTNYSDPLYGNVYTGEPILIKDSVLAVNIAMNAKDVNWQEYSEKKIKNYLGFSSKVKKFIFSAIFFVGLFGSIIILYFYPSLFNFSIAFFYFAIFVYDYLIKEKKYGVITSKKDRKPTPFTVVELHDPDTEERENFTVSDILGRYYLLANNGRHKLSVKSMSSLENSFKVDYDIEVRRGILKKDLVI